MPEDQQQSSGGLTNEEWEDLECQRVVLLDPPPTAENMIVTLPDGTTFRPMELMVRPLCRGDYLLETSKLLPTKYEGFERAVGVCPTCTDNPPRDYRRKLRVALGRFPWCGKGEEVGVAQDVQSDLKAIQS